MAEFKYKGFNKVNKSVGDRIAKVIRGSGVLEVIADTVIREIQEGFSPKTGRPFKALKQKTIDRRKRLATKNVTDPNYSASKSNLTFTGQLIRSIKAKINRSKSLIIIEPTGRRKAYSGIRKAKLKKSVDTNAELALKHARGEGNLPKRDIISFSKKRVKEITEIISSAIKKEFK